MSGALKPLPATMRAAVVRRYREQKEEGEEGEEWGECVGVVRDHPAPRGKLGARQVLVRVHAAALNPVDYKWAQGNFEIVPGTPKPAYVPGFDAAGRVVQVGSACERLRVGDRVYAFNSFRRQGTAAEYAVVDEACAAAKPASLTYAEAASLPLVALTSMQALEKAAVGAGSRVLVLGGTGGTGTVALQLAKAGGAAEVICTCSAAGAEMARGLGADRCIDYRGAAPWWEELAGAGLDAVYDTVGGYESWERSAAVLRPGGRFVSICGDRQDKVTLGRALTTVGGVINRKFWGLLGLGPSYEYFSADNCRHDQLAHLADMVDAGLVRPVVDRVYDLDEAAAAFAHVAGGRSKGKVVLRVVAESEDN